MAEAVAELVRRRRWPLSLAVCALALVAGVWVLAVNDTGSPTSRLGPRPGVPVAVNRPAPNVVAPLLDGRGNLALDRQSGPVVVNFWASWCTACKGEAPALHSLWRSYGDRGVRFVGVDYEDRPGAAVTAARALNMRYPSVRDADGSIGDAFGIVGLPTTYVIGTDHRIRYVVVGRVRAPSFRTALDSVLGSSTGSARP